VKRAQWHQRLFSTAADNTPNSAEYQNAPISSIEKKLSSFIQLKPGTEFHLTRIFTPSDGEIFAKLTGDSNPIHEHSSNDAIIDKFNQQDNQQLDIVAGMLTCSLFSTIFGTTFPNCRYVSQSLEFKRPVYYNDKLLATIRVDAQKKRFVECITVIVNTSRNNEVAVVGKAKVWIPNLDLRN